MDELSELLIDNRTDEKFNRLFRNALKKNKFSVEKRGSRDYYTVTDGSASLGFDVSAEKYEFARSRSSASVTELIERVKRDFYILERMVSFTNGQEFIRFTVMREEEIGKGMISDSFMGSLKRVICYTGDNIRSRPLPEEYMKKWDVPKEVLFSVADRNMCRLLKNAEYTESPLDSTGAIRCLDFKAEGSDFTVALMMCSDFRNHISRVLGHRFLVAAPSKDTMLALSEVTNDVVERLGTAIVGEYRFATRPLTTDVFHFSSSGVKIAGHFSEVDG
ncbi:MAG: hypothetical protein J6A37_14180 [Oscillospiraceae bacterium]|nr:hypothetical protein [Oscillospiraceae bacterium]